MEQYNVILFDDLIMRYLNGDEKILDILYKRLHECGLDIISSTNIIEGEVEVLRRRKVKKNFVIGNRTWWIYKTPTLKWDLKAKKIFTLNIEDYWLYNNGQLSDYALLLDELVSIHDESIYILNNLKSLNKDVYEEIYNVGEFSDERSWVLDEVYSRFNHMYHLANKIIFRDYPIDRTIVEKFINKEKEILTKIKWQ